MAEDNKQSETPVNAPLYGDSQPAQPATTKTEEDKPQVNNITVQSGNTIIYKIVIYAIIFIIVAGVGLFVADKFYDIFHTKDIKASQEQMQDPETAKQVIEKESGLNISDYQAKEVAKTMTDSTPGAKNYKEPERVVEVKGNDVKKATEEFRKQTGGDVVVTTDPNKPNEKPKIDSNTTYRLEQRSYKLYPDQQWSTTVYNDGSVAVDYDKKVQVFGNTGYLGVSVLDDKQENGHHQVKYGVKVTLPI